MGTRGAWGFVIDGDEKIAYNHFDSYPSGLGSDILQAIRGVDIEVLRADARRLRVIQDGEVPTPEDVERLHPWTDLSVGSRSAEDWYCLTRGAQGDVRAALACGIIEDGSDFPADSLFCEWAYVVDLDTATFEVCRGFQMSPHSRGRFAGREVPERSVGPYYPVALVASYPLSNLPEGLRGVEEGED